MLGLRTVIYNVGDLDAAIKWYSLVFECNPYFNEPFYVGFNIKGFELGLQEMESTGEKPENILAYWGVEDIASEFKRFVKLGAKVHEKPNKVGGEIMVASVKDPWGNILGLIYNPSFKIEA